MKALIIPLLFVQVFVNDDLDRDGTRLYCVDVPAETVPTLLADYEADPNRLMVLAPEYPFQRYKCNTFCHPRPMQYALEETHPFSWDSVYHADNPAYPPNSWGGLIK